MSEEQVVSTEATEDFQPSTLSDIFDSPSNGDVKEESKETEVKETEEAKTEEKAESKESEPESSPTAVDWEAEDNPYKKRYTETQKWGNEAHKKYKELQKEYGLAEEPEVTEEDRIAELAFNEREKASLAVAREIYGDEHITKMLYSPDAPFQQMVKNDPNIYHRVQNAEAPVMEALKVVREVEFFNKYGRDVEKIPDKIRKEIEADLREKITKELQKKLSNKEKLPTTLSGVNSTDVKDNGDRYVPPTTKELFG